MAEIKKGKIVFIDDQAGTVNPFIDHLREEGFTNIVLYSDVRTLNQLDQAQADLVFLDIGGVATSLAGAEEGLAVLRYLKRELPWTRVVVLSGSTFAAEKAPELALADQCRTKGSLGLAELTSLVKSELHQALSPEWRNPRIAEVLLNRLEDLNLGAYRRWRIRRYLRKAVVKKGDDDFDWIGLAEKTRKALATVTEVAGFVALFI